MRWGKTFILLLPLCLLTGCAGRGAGDLLPILSAGISSSSDDALTLTAEAVRQDSLEGNAASVYLTTSGDTPEHLFSGAEQLLAGQLYLSHARTFVIDESVAREGIEPLVQALLARSDVRLTLRIAVARDVTADKLCAHRRSSKKSPVPHSVPYSMRTPNTATCPTCRYAVWQTAFFRAVTSRFPPSVSHKMDGSFRLEKPIFDWGA